MSWDVPPQHREFARRVEAARLQDPAPTFERLSQGTGIPVEALLHYALVDWTSAGAESLLAIEPQALKKLIAAREAEDWPAVAGILDWLASGR